MVDMDAMGGLVVPVEQLMETSTALESTMEVEVDPLECSMAAFASADEAESSVRSGSPVRSVVISPVTPRKEFHSAAEGSPGASIV